VAQLRQDNTSVHKSRQSGDARRSVAYRFVMRLPSRRVLAAAVALVLAGGAGAALRVASRDRGTTGLTSIDEPPAFVPAFTPSPTTAAPTPSPTPSPTPTRSPSPTSTVPPDERASLAGETGDGLGPHPPGSVTLAYRAGQTTWDATSNGVHLHIGITAGAKVGSPVTWTVTARDGDKDCCGVYVVYGDGYTAPSQLDCDSLGAGTFQRQHTYNKAGRHHFLVQGTSNRCQRNGEVYGSFDVGPGVSTAQGPTLPTVQFDSSTPVKGHENDPAYVTLWGHAEDEDGHITKLVVTFGDGTSATYGGDPNPCKNGLDGWPTGSYADVPYEPPPAHHYTKPGTYTLTLTAYSSACNGAMVQTGKASFTREVPGPTPTAVSS
jgi:hypothetical protein